MKINIYSLRGTLFEGEATSLNLRTTTGDLTILNNQRPIVSILKRGSVKLTTQTGQTKVFEVESGFLEVGLDNAVNILASV
jgi:F0F1-type ATP synthase epsilon subunit